jgi:hypothetical protein
MYANRKAKSTKNQILQRLELTVQNPTKIEKGGGYVQ